MSKPKGIIPISKLQGKMNIILYGEPGTGKSVIVGTSPKCLILANDCDEPISPAVQGSEAEVWVMQDYNDLSEAYEYLRHNPTDYDWVWLDNCTLFQEQGMDQIMEDLVAAKPHRNRYIPDMHEYLLNQNRLGVWIRDMKGLPFNFGLTMHTMRIEDQETGEMTYLPLLQGKQGEYSQKICGYMNVVGYVTRRKGKDDKYHTIVETNKNKKFYAKDRFDALGGRLVDPTIPKMEELIREKRTAGKSAAKSKKKK